MKTYKKRQVVVAPSCFVALALLVIPIHSTRSAFADPAVEGKWGDVMNWPNVAIHTHVLPNGKVLFWGRREWKADRSAPLPNPDTHASSLDVHETIPRIWDPQTKTFTETPKVNVNLFCSGHTFLADGRLFVVGGHIHDQEGLNTAFVYDPVTNKWAQKHNSNNGRWYPTAISLSDGDVLVSSGSFKHKNKIVMNVVQQVWRDKPDNQVQWREIVRHDDLPYYPRMHVTTNANGDVFLAGGVELTQVLNTSGTGDWTFLVPGNFNASLRPNMAREYAPSVMYDFDKVLFIGGRNPPSEVSEFVDLNHPGWKLAASMNFKRTQHNATLLPDGTVLVTGGTRGTGGKPETHGRNGGFNDLRANMPVHHAELWTPSASGGSWIQLAEEAEDRCYHSTAVLLPDATVLSAGGGEYRPDDQMDVDNAIVDSHLTAQIFTPPYLCRSGARPQITHDVTSPIGYGQTFEVQVSDLKDVGKVNWVRLSSVTHSFNMNQRVNFLNFQINNGSLKVTAPSDSKACPPGHYMLFVLGKTGIPSIAKIVQIH
jgi:hypothetical protein